MNRRSFWLLNKVVNPFVRLILRSPLHFLLSGSVILLSYNGRRSGARRTHPVQYALEGDEFIILVGQHQRKKWWLNLRSEAHVKVLYRGYWLEGLATILQGDENVVAPRLAIYLKRFPSSARYRGVTLGAEGEADLEELREAARSAVMVRITADLRS